MSECTGKVTMNGTEYAIPERQSDTLGVTRGNPDLNMPPFAVDAGYAQGNGDVSDAIITLRGPILDGSISGMECTVHFAALSADDADVVTALLEFALNWNDPEWLASVTGVEGEWRGKPDAVSAVELLLDRIQNIPGATKRFKRPTK